MRPGTPVVHLLSKSSHASADSRGRLAPTSGRRAKHLTGTARLPRAGSSSASAGSSRAHAPVCDSAARERGAWAVGLERLQGVGTSTCAGWPLPRQRAARLRTATWPPSVATFPSEEEGVRCRAVAQGRLLGYRKACAPKTTMGTFPSDLHRSRFIQLKFPEPCYLCSA